MRQDFFTVGWHHGCFGVTVDARARRQRQRHDARAGQILVTVRMERRESTRGPPAYWGGMVLTVVPARSAYPRMRSG